MRQPPRYIENALKDYDSRLAIRWDNDYNGWRLVYNGEDQQSIMFHEDGTIMYELNESELIRIVARMDMYNHMDAPQKARARQREICDRRRASRERFKESTLIPALADMTDFTVNRGRQAKPFSLVTNNPLAKGAKSC